MLELLRVLFLSIAIERKYEEKYMIVINNTYYNFKSQILYLKSQIKDLLTQTKQTYHYINILKIIFKDLVKSCSLSSSTT